MIDLRELRRGERITYRGGFGRNEAIVVSVSRRYRTALVRLTRLIGPGGRDQPDGIGNEVWIRAEHDPRRAERGA